MLATTLLLHWLSITVILNYGLLVASASGLRQPVTVLLLRAVVGAANRVAARLSTKDFCHAMQLQG